MVFNASLSNDSVIPWRSVLLVEEQFEQCFSYTVKVSFIGGRTVWAMIQLYREGQFYWWKNSLSNASVIPWRSVLLVEEQFEQWFSYTVKVSFIGGRTVWAMLQLYREGQFYWWKNSLSNDSVIPWRSVLLVEEQFEQWFSYTVKVSFIGGRTVWAMIQLYREGQFYWWKNSLSNASVIPWRSVLLVEEQFEQCFSYTVKVSFIGGRTVWAMLQLYCEGQFYWWKNSLSNASVIPWRSVLLVEEQFEQCFSYTVKVSFIGGRTVWAMLQLYREGQFYWWKNSLSNASVIPWRSVLLVEEQFEQWFSYTVKVSFIGGRTVWAMIQLYREGQFYWWKNSLSNASVIPWRSVLLVEEQFEQCFSYTVKVSFIGGRTVWAMLQLYREGQCYWWKNSLSNASVIPWRSVLLVEEQFEQCFSYTVKVSFIGGRTVWAMLQLYREGQFYWWKNSLSNASVIPWRSVLLVEEQFEQCFSYTVKVSVIGGRTVWAMLQLYREGQFYWWKNSLSNASVILWRSVLLVEEQFEQCFSYTVKVSFIGGRTVWAMLQLYREGQCYWWKNSLSNASVIPWRSVLLVEEQFEQWFSYTVKVSFIGGRTVWAMLQLYREGQFYWWKNSLSNASVIPWRSVLLVEEQFEQCFSYTVKVSFIGGRTVWAMLQLYREGQCYWWKNSLSNASVIPWRSVLLVEEQFEQCFSYTVKVSFIGGRTVWAMLQLYREGQFYWWKNSLSNASVIPWRSVLLVEEQFEQCFSYTVKVSFIGGRTVWAMIQLYREGQFYWWKNSLSNASVIPWRSVLLVEEQFEQCFSYTVKVSFIGGRTVWAMLQLYREGQFYWWKNSLSNASVIPWRSVLLVEEQFEQCFSYTVKVSFIGGRTVWAMLQLYREGQFYWWKNSLSNASVIPWRSVLLVEEQFEQCFSYTVKVSVIGGRTVWAMLQLYREGQCYWWKNSLSNASVIPWRSVLLVEEQFEQCFSYTVKVSFIGGRTVWAMLQLYREGQCYWWKNSLSNASVIPWRSVLLVEEQFEQCFSYTVKVSVIGGRTVWAMLQLYREGQCYWWKNSLSNASVIPWRSVLLVEEVWAMLQLYGEGQFYWWKKFEQCFSYIVEVSFIGGRNQSTRRKPPTNFITQCCIEYTSPWTGIELTTLLVIGTDCKGSCKSNYNTLTTTTAPATVNIRGQSKLQLSYQQFI